MKKNNQTRITAEPGKQEIVNTDPPESDEGLACVEVRPINTNENETAFPYPTNI